MLLLSRIVIFFFPLRTCIIFSGTMEPSQKEGFFVKYRFNNLHPVLCLVFINRDTPSTPKRQTRATTKICIFFGNYFVYPNQSIKRRFLYFFNLGVEDLWLCLPIPTVKSRNITVGKTYLLNAAILYPFFSVPEIWVIKKLSSHRIFMSFIILYHWTFPARRLIE